MSLQARTVAPPSLDTVKMEDRKRPGGPDDSAPPAKRQAVVVNGTRPHADADLPWKEDIEAFQKDAILRQMREYKREKATIESQLAEMEKRSQYHDEHLRTIDIWFDQLVDEIQTLSGEKLPSPQHDGPARPVPATLFFEDSQGLRKHLTDRKEKILSSLSGLFAKYPPASPEVSSLQQQISKLLAAEKEHICELQRVQTEKEQKSDRLLTATHRYMVAEKKIDRLKSAEVQKLESAAMASSTVGVKEETPSGSNGVELANGVSAHLAEEVEMARNQALAEAAKRKEHIELLEADNKKLTEEVSALNVKLAGLSDDDYAKTDLFKALKTQHESVIKRINDVEAINIQLREEVQKYRAERSAYRTQLEEETRATLGEGASNVVQAQTDLARIRHSRDDLLTKLNMLESAQKQVTLSSQQTKELVSAGESRIAALQSECERLRLQLEERGSGDGPADLDTLSPEELHGKVVTLKRENELLANELPGMEAAWKKAQAVAGKKIAEIATWEENVTRANADKAKADQKFFAAMKAKEALEQQLRMLRAQTTKSTEVVAQLKETDSLSRSLVEKLEKQTAEMRAQMDELSIQHRQLQLKLNESAIAAEAHISQIAELKKVVETKDTTCLAAKKSQRESEVERDKMAAQVEGLERQLDHWKEKSIGNQSAQNAMMESMLQCQICKSKFKDTVIKTCGHVFCDQCIQDRLTNRARKCPNCGKAFGNNDTMRIHM
ncbi:BRE1-domain-containing protein [Lentithecium fluviatile CBS 122367]|uniref:E3 ubiquitin protein ligase n=1 Tax=Lentithecium fluviatile CBS 122367 TaxID=1168545 RepID=A0A6G1ILY0_9PLEO|nr:BRE1-domain-containing protein [Lentithecium fluviatile CBS 122367]